MAYIDNKAAWLRGERVRGLARAHVWASTQVIITYTHTPSHTHKSLSRLRRRCKLRHEKSIRVRPAGNLCISLLKRARALRSLQFQLNIRWNYLSSELRRGKKRSLRCLTRALDFLSQDINEEMTHTCKEKKKREGRRRERKGVREGCSFQGDEGWWLIPLWVDSAGNSIKRTEKRGF